MVRIQEHKVVVIESRKRIGFDRNLGQEGVLVYTVDTTRPTGAGPIAVQGEYPGVWPDSSVLLQMGEQLVVEEYTVTLERQSAETDLVTVVQTR